MGVTVSAQSSDSIYLSWDSVSGASYYNVYRATSASGDYTFLVYTSSTSYTDTGLSSGATYYYKVTAYSSSYGESGYSSYASATTLSSSGTGTLVSGQWADGTITYSGQTLEYSFPVSYGTTYYVWWNDSYRGNGTYSLDVKVSARYSGGSTIFDPVDSAWDDPQNFYATSSGTVILTVQAYSGSATGTFAVAYRTSDIRP
jgi:hypothetical protein